jgi:hypothetical protein
VTMPYSDGGRSLAKIIMATVDMTVEAAKPQKERKNIYDSSSFAVSRGHLSISSRIFSNSNLSVML